MLANLALPVLYSGLPGTVGPRVVVLCQGHAEATDLGLVISALVDRSKLGFSVVATRARDKGGMMADIVNGCDVLLVNPTQLVNLCDDLSLILSRCCHLIIESGHKTLDFHEQSVEQIWLQWRKCKFAVKADQNCPDQVVVVSEAWNQPVMDFVENFMRPGTHLNPVLIFSSFTEAAVYKREIFTPSFHKDSGEKINHLRSLLKGSSEKSVICFSSSKHLRYTEAAISSDGLDVFSVNPELDQVDQDDIVKDWTSSGKCVLLITDKSIRSLRSLPGSSQNLFHFDIPVRSKNSFSARFTFIRDELRKQRRDIPLTRTFVLASAKDKPAFKSLYSIMLRIHPNAHSVLTELRSDKLCRSISEADLTCVRTCNQRHWLRAGDAVQEGRLSGVLTLRVLRVVSPVEYVVTQLSPGLDARYQSRAFSMARHFCNLG